MSTIYDWQEAAFIAALDENEERAKELLRKLPEGPLVELGDVCEALREWVAEVLEEPRSALPELVESRGTWIGTDSYDNYYRELGVEPPSRKEPIE